MIIAVASGKGGTGKTTVSTNLARVLSDKYSVQYLDCDVEEPNGYLFLKADIKHSVKVKVPVPKVDHLKCTHCRECSAFCEYKAIVSLPMTTMVFPELCHSCGGCTLVCPAGAITEKERTIGIIERGNYREIDLVYGKLNVGEAKSPPLIKEVNRYIADNGVVLVDSPPGTSCPVVASLREAEKVLLVAEPTPFGLNDFQMVAEMVKSLNIPLGVVINRYDVGDNKLEKYFKKEEIPIWGRIPDDRRIAELYSRGELITEKLPDIKNIFEEIGETLLKGGLK